MKQLRLTIESNLENVSLIGLAINRICQHLRLNEVQAYQVELCAVEALTNVIRHSYQNQPGHEVEVILTITNHHLDMEVCDHGEPMSPDCVQRLRQGSGVFQFDHSDLASVPESGMGLQIMRDVMDQVSYVSGGGDGRMNRLCLCLRLP